MSSIKKTPSGVPIRVRKHRPVETDSEEEDFTREPARKFFRANANTSTTAGDAYNNSNTNSNANETTPEINYAKKSSRPSTAKSTNSIPTITLERGSDQVSSRSKAAIKDRDHEDLELDYSEDDGDIKKGDEMSEPACLPPTPPSPLSSMSPVGKAMTAIKNTVEGRERRKLMPNDLHNKNLNTKEMHECLTGQLALLIDCHNKFIDTVRHLFGAIVNQPNNICKSCSSKIDLAAANDN